MQTIQFTQHLEGWVTTRLHENYLMLRNTGIKKSRIFLTFPDHHSFLLDLKFPKQKAISGAPLVMALSKQIGHRLESVCFGALKSDFTSC